MEQIKIIFFALASFFGMEDGRIAADKTTVTVYPENREVQIVQDKLFTIIQSEKDSILVLQQWDKLLNLEERNTILAKELARFSVKGFEINSTNNSIQPFLSLSYAKENDLRALGIWYNADENQFSINHTPSYNIKTKNGKLNGNYWYFCSDSAFSFTIEPFLQMPKNYQQMKVPLREFL